MNANPFLGVFFHWLGGLAAGSFYVPYRGVRRWSWETYWLVGGFFSWIIAPWLIGYLMTSDLLAVLRETPWESTFWPYFWGIMWGLGGLTFGLTMRYLGMSLGMAMALGYCAAFGTLAPPIYHGEFAQKLLQTCSGWVILAGVAVCLAGIAITGLAGRSKEREMPAEQRTAAIKEFNFKKGLLVATFSGILSASFSYGLDRGQIIKCITLRNDVMAAWRADNPQKPGAVDEHDLAREAAAVAERLKAPDLKKAVAEIDESIKKAKNDPDLSRVLRDYKEDCLLILGRGGDLKHYLDRYTLWQGLPVLVVVLLGGFTTNFIWCVALNVKNRTGHQYFSRTYRDHAPGRQQETIIETAIDAPSEEMVEAVRSSAFRREEPAEAGTTNVPLVWNYVFCALAGTTWYFQFFFYSMGETQMGDYKFSSWTLHMASIIIFSTLWGIALREWKGSSRRTIRLVTLGLAVLVGSTVIVGYGNYRAAQEESAKALQQMEAR